MLLLIGPKPSAQDSATEPIALCSLRTHTLLFSAFTLSALLGLSLSLSLSLQEERACNGFLLSSVWRGKKKKQKENTGYSVHTSVCKGQVKSTCSVLFRSSKENSDEVLEHVVLSLAPRRTREGGKRSTSSVKEKGFVSY